MSYDFEIIRNWDDTAFVNNLSEASAQGWEIINITSNVVHVGSTYVRRTPDDPTAHLQHVAYLRRHKNYEFEKKMADDLLELIRIGPNGKRP